jgi:hypothetical protein
LQEQSNLQQADALLRQLGFKSSLLDGAPANPFSDDVADEEADKTQAATQ